MRKSSAATRLDATLPAEDYSAAPPRIPYLRRGSFLSVTPLIRSYDCRAKLRPEENGYKGIIPVEIRAEQRYCSFYQRHRRRPNFVRSK